MLGIVLLSPVQADTSTFEHNADGQSYSYLLPDGSFENGNFPDNINWSQQAVYDAYGNLIAPSNWDPSPPGDNLLIPTAPIDDISTNIDSLSVTSSGSVNVQGGVTLNIANFGQSDGTISVDGLLTTGTFFTNNNLIEADEGTVDFNGTTVAQGSNGVILADSNTVYLDNGAVIIGGTLNTANGGVISITSGVNGFTALTNNGYVQINYGSTLNVSANLDGNGQIFNYGSTLNFSNATVGANQSITGGYNGVITGSVNNNGTVNSTYGWLNLENTNLVNNNLIEATGGAVDINGATITQGSNGVIMTAGNLLCIDNSSITGGTLFSANGGVITINSGSNGFSALTNNAYVQINNNATLNVTGTLGGNGTVNVNGNTLNLSNATVGAFQTITGGGSVNISGSATNNGRVNALSGGDTMVNPAGTLVNNGVIGGTTIVNGTLGGNGGSFSNLVLNSGSFLTWNIDSFTGTAGTNWDVLSAQSLDLSDLSATNPLTIDIVGSSGPGDGSSVYSFNFLSVSGSVTGYNPSDIDLSATFFTPDPGIGGGNWSVETNAFAGITEFNAV